MTTGFHRSRGGGAHASFAAVEARMVSSLAAQVVELLRDGGTAPGAVGGQVGEDADDPLTALVGLGAEGPVVKPDDPVLARLLPDAYSDDESEAAEFRRFTEPGLRDRKVANAAAVIGSLAGAEDADEESAGDTDEESADEEVDVVLDAAGVDAWLRCLTDIRLALGTRLAVEEGDEGRWAALPDEDPAKAMHDVYDWLAFVQETLLRTLR